MFPKNGNKWTMAELDQLDVHFFYEVIAVDEFEEKEIYLSDVW